MQLYQRAIDGKEEEMERGELFSFLLRLHPLEQGKVALGAGNQVQAAFLDLVRQADPQLSERLHAPNQRRPYTLGLLQGFNHLTEKQAEGARNSQQMISVQPGQTYWLRLTMLDATLFNTFAQSLLLQARALTLRIGEVHLEVSRLLSEAETGTTTNPWLAYSSFAELYTLHQVERTYSFEFITPTAFSRGQREWGKILKVFPEPALVFESLARRWEAFAPPHLHMSVQNLSPYMLGIWCEEHLVVTRYRLHTGHIPSSRFGQTGFQGVVTYEVKGDLTEPEARWLTPLARFALFSGVGYKTTMGMGQARCLYDSVEAAQNAADEEED